MKRFSIPPREERERHSHTMSAYTFVSKENMYKTTALRNKCRIFVHNKTSVIWMIN